MEIDKTVSNPMLAGAMQLIKADGKTPVPEHQALFMQELDKADLLAPVEVHKELDEDGNPRKADVLQFVFPCSREVTARDFSLCFRITVHLSRPRVLKDLQGFLIRFLSIPRQSGFLSSQGCFLPEIPTDQRILHLV